MKDLKDICLMTQARLSSERLPRKMIRPFANSSLIEIAVNKMLASKVIPKEQCVLSVHEPELVEVGQKCGIPIFHRSEKSAKSEGNPITEIYEWHDKLPFKYVIMVNSCCPMLTTETIDNFIIEFSNSDFDGMFGVIKKKNYFWKKERQASANVFTGPSLVEWPEGQVIMNTKIMAETLEAAHVLYASRIDTIKDGVWMGDLRGSDPKLGFFAMDEHECLDIDYPWQFEAWEAVYKDKLRIANEDVLR